MWKLGLNRKWASRWMLLCGPNLFYWANEKVRASPHAFILSAPCLIAGSPTRRPDCGPTLVRRPSLERSPQE